ncbi:MAG: subclass B3 metallo-beta-lactamase [Sphingomonas sp.]|jgi:metallo-beta-lactamase class B
MSVKAAFALMLAATTMPVTAKTADVIASQGKALAAACKGRDGWTDPAPPAHIFGTTYYVGTCGITVLLITSPKGHVLIDSGPVEAAPFILANIRKLGLRPSDVKLLVGSHEHFDHMGGFAALKAATGAEIRVRAPARLAIETGRTDPDDPQASFIDTMAPAIVGRPVADGETIGPRAAHLTAMATPGHTSGGTSWNWTACEKRRCVAMAYVDSLSAISRDDYRFTDHPTRVAPYRTTLALVAAMKCDVLITPHPELSNLFARLAGEAPLVDPTGCKRLAENATAAIERRLASERTAPTR